MSLSENLHALAARVAVESRALRLLINGNQPNLSALTTTTKTNLVAAINELAAAVTSGTSGINDGVTATTTTWSSTKTQAQIQAGVAAAIDAAPGTLDTLNELAAALNDDPNFSATMTAALGKRVRVDAAQTFTTGEKTQARTNIGAADTAHTHTYVWPGRLWHADTSTWDARPAVPAGVVVTSYSLHDVAAPPPPSSQNLDVWAHHKDAP